MALSKQHNSHKEGKPAFVWAFESSFKSFQLVDKSTCSKQLRNLSSEGATKYQQASKLPGGRRSNKKNTVWLGVALG